MKMRVLQANGRGPQKNNNILGWKFGEQWNGSDRTKGGGRNLGEFVVSGTNTQIRVCPGRS
jgi:hypothetical protein